MQHSTVPQTLADLMQQHGITVEWTSAEGYHLDANGWEHQRYRFRLEIAGELTLDNAPFRAGLACDEPSPADLFGAVLLDVSMTLGHEDWATWADEFGLVTDAQSAKKAQADYHEIKARESLLLERLGEDVLAQLIEATD